MPCFIRRSSSSTLGNAGRRALLDDDALPGGDQDGFHAVQRSALADRLGIFT